MEAKKQYPIISNIEAMTFEINCGKMIDITLLVVYRKPGSVGDFIDLFEEQIQSLPTNKRLLIVGDFNLDQRDINLVRLFDSVINRFSLTQRSKFTTHSQGGILDLVFDNKKGADDAKILPFPFSDHFIIIFDL
jgi:hypothetical protein